MDNHKRSNTDQVLTIPSQFYQHLLFLLQGECATLFSTGQKTIEYKKMSDTKLQFNTCFFSTN